MGDMINPCCICQEEIVGAASLDNCSLICIRKWAEVKYPPLSCIPCPLCKSKSTTIFYNFDSSIGCFDKQCFGQNVHDSFILYSEHRYRLKSYQDSSLVDPKSFGVEEFWRFKKFLQPKTHLLEAWLRRELYALLLDKDPNVIVHHIIGTIEHFSRTFKDRQQKDASPSVSDSFKAAISTAASPFLRLRTERFVEELILYMASGLNLQSYDDFYKKCPNDRANGELVSWIEQKLGDFNLLTSNDHLIHSCLSYARSSRSSQDYEAKLVKSLHFPSTTNTNSFAKLLFDRVHRIKRKR